MLTNLIDGRFESAIQCGSDRNPQSVDRLRRFAATSGLVVPRVRTKAARGRRGFKVAGRRR